MGGGGDPPWGPIGDPNNPPGCGVGGCGGGGDPGRRLITPPWKGTPQLYPSGAPEENKGKSGIYLFRNLKNKKKFL